MEKSLISMPFGDAISEIKKDGRNKMKLPHWQDDVYISVQSPDENSKMTAPYFFVTSRYGMVPWIPTMIEMFSEQWRVS